MRETHGADEPRLLNWLLYRTQRHSLPAILSARPNKAPHVAVFALTALLIQFLVQLLFVQRPFATPPLQASDVAIPHLPPRSDVVYHPSCGEFCSAISDEVGNGSAARTRKTIVPTDNRLLYDADPTADLTLYIPPSNGQRYFVTSYYSFTIDVSHFETAMERSRDILKDLDRNRSITAVRDQIRSIPGVGALGYTSEYAIFRSPTTRAERERIAWGIYLHSQRLFERWQGSGLMSLGNEWLRGSSYANEDLPSDYLGFFAAARYPDLSAEDALKAIARQLGGGVWTSKEPPHAGSIGYQNMKVKNAVALPFHWGDLRLKNPTYTPRVAGEYGWYNVAWPPGLSIDPIWQGVYWRYWRSYNTRNGEAWF